ncbi:uncharacterized protein [Apostichopus japonicus]|uniref:uncharacterized protein n=1 Tax=Stichopus japonicus TaxID=307972 RepID=UPI003AB1859E
MSAPWVILLLALSVSIGETEASHFRGGLITWRPVDPIPSSNQSNIPQIEISYRMSWRRSAGSHHYCTDEHIAGGNLLDGEGYLDCNCYGLNQQLSYVCTDFSESEDWTSGVSSGFYQPNIPYFQVWFSGCCWISLRNDAGGDWFLMAAIDLSVRNDTGRINSSPTTTTLPILRYHQECHNTITIPVADPDGDDVRCFWATNCGSGCFNLPGAVLDNGTCVITWDTTGLSVGLYGVSIEIMDFATPTSTQPLSYIPLQFLVDVFSSSVSCLDQPVFIPPTRVPDSCVGIPENGTYHEPIIARTSSVNVTITEITTISPSGMVKSELLPYPDGLPTDYYINTTWNPITVGEEEIMCFNAETNLGSVGAQTCITLITGNPPPEIITIRPGKGEHTPLEDLQVLVRYDQAVARPSRSTMISLHTQTGSNVYQVDSQNYQQVSFPGDNTLQFVVPAQYLSEMTSYYILMESGAARTTTYCGIESAAIVDPNQLTFFVTQVPTTTASPNVTNKTATVTPTPNDDDDFGDEIVLRCGPTSFQIDIPRKLVEDSFETTGLYLLGGDGNPGCMSFDNHQYISLNSSLTGCGNQYTDNSTHSFYSNTVVNHDNNTNMIVEYLSLQIPFTCEYDRSKKLLSHFVTISEYIMKREKGSFVYDFAMYTDISYTVRYNTYPVEAHLGTNLFFRSELLRAADNLEIHLRSCRATPSPNYEDDLVYEFITDGCGANNAAVRVLTPQTPKQADFEISSFRFRRDIGNEYSQVWVHCEVIVCDVNDTNSECRRGCEESRYRRSIRQYDQKVERLVRGPILLEGIDDRSETLKASGADGTPHNFSAVFTTSLSIVVVAMVISLMMISVAYYRVMRRLTHHSYEALPNNAGLNQ